MVHSLLVLGCPEETTLFRIKIIFKCGVPRTVRSGQVAYETESSEKVIKQETMANKLIPHHLLTQARKIGLPI